jgi:hypothetical protein
MVSVLGSFCAWEGKAKRISKDPDRKRIVQNRLDFIPFTSKIDIYILSLLQKQAP